jgi:hypothetical protein
MKTTLDLNATLLAEAKALAAKQRTTLTRVVEEGLRLRIGATRTARKAVASAPPPVFRGKGGLKAGIDPLSNRSMLDAADADDA